MSNRERDIIITMFKTIRLREKWTLRQAARYLDITHPFLIRIERNQQYPSQEILMRMAFLVTTKVHIYQA